MPVSWVNVTATVANTKIYSDTAITYLVLPTSVSNITVGRILVDLQEKQRHNL